MATPTYDKITSIVLDSSASSVTFDDIPTQDANGNSYKDLVLVYNGQTTGSGNYDIQLKLNGDFSTYTSAVVAYGTGSSSGSFTQATANIANAGAGNRTSMVAHIQDYSASNKHTTSLVRLDSGASVTVMAAQRYGATTVITSVTVAIAVGTFDSGSTFDLYAIAG